MGAYIDLFIFLIALWHKLPSCAASYSYKYIPGILGDEWRIQVSIFADEFQGIILYCTDSKSNQMIIKVTKRNLEEKDIFFKFKNYIMEESLLEICHCRLCNRRKMDLDIRYRQSIFDLKCNNHQPATLSIVDTRKEIDNLYPIVNYAVKGRAETLVMIGNKGPFKSYDNRTTPQFLIQMVGCVNSFYYNGTMIPLLSTGMKVKPTCVIKCEYDTCNGGKCHLISHDSVSCDCSQVALNGQYCNDTLKVYKRDQGTSFKGAEDSNNVFVKISWAVSGTYCLLEIVGESTNSVILTSSVEHNKTKDINFVAINITKGYVTVHGNVYGKFLWSKKLRINIGYSQENGTCETLVGQYDFHYNSSQLQEITVKKSDITFFMYILSKKFEILIAAIIILIFIACIVICYRNFNSKCTRKKKNKSVIYEDVNIQRTDDEGVYSYPSDYVYYDHNNGDSDYLPMTAIHSPELPPRNVIA